MRWPGPGRAAARFARAVDRAAAGPDAGSDAGRAVDADARAAGLVAVVDRLRSLGGRAADPEPVFRDRLRERLVATATVEWAGNPPGVERKPARLRPPVRRARLRYALAGVSVGLLLTGGLVVASASALPGDLLYPVKRATERVELAVVFGQEAKGRAHLALARTRVEELQAL